VLDTMPRLFPLFCGSQVRVYHAASVRNLEEARECFLEMAVGVNSDDRIRAPQDPRMVQHSTVQYSTL